MLRFLGLAVFVVCIAAFASGCGGGGGGSASAPVMECPQGQVGTYPDCMDPPPTDEQRIAEARQTLAGIVADARARAQTASSVAGAVGANEDATADQIANALARAGDAQVALAAVVAASSAANAATTPAQAEMAVADARTALGDLMAAESAVAAIQNAVNAVAEARRQREANEIALTNNSSLIKHVRANKLLADALLEDLVSADGGDNRIVVGPVGNGSAGANGVATYPADSVTGGVRNVGQRTVQMQGLTSNSKTPPLTGTGRLPHGFDLNNGTTTFVDAYTDITKTVKRSGDNPRTSADETDDGYELVDADYLLAGTWLSVGATIAESTITAFAYGNQAITNTYQIAGAAANACTNAEGTNTTNASNEVTHTRTCTEPTGFDLISSFVQDGKDITAVYRGDANGIYIAGGETSYFTGDVELTAEFQNPTSADAATTDGTGSIQGAVSNIKAGGQRIEGDIELQKLSLGTAADRNNISPAFTGVAAGVIEGKIYTGGWKGQFFGMKYTRGSKYTPATTQNGTTTPQSTATTYSPQHPGSVAGTFQVIKQSAPVGDAAFIGSFGAHR